MKKIRVSILIGGFILIFCIIGDMRSYGDYDDIAEYLNNVARYANDAYKYAKKAYTADTLEEAQYYAEKAMTAAEYAKNIAYDAESKCNRRFEEIEAQ